MRTLLVVGLLLLSSRLPAQITNLSFTWDAVTNAEVYRFWDGNKAVLLGTTTNLVFTVTNWNISTGRVVSVTASNELGESATTVHTVKPAATAPANLKPVPLSIVTPLPGVLEISPDLVDWKQRIRLVASTDPSSVSVTWVTYPTDPLLFMRSKSPPPVSTPPVP